MEQLFFYELNKTLQGAFSKNIFIVKRMKKVFSLETAVDRNLFLQHLRINI